MKKELKENDLLNNKDFDTDILNIGGLRNEYLPLVICLKNLLKYDKTW